MLETRQVKRLPHLGVIRYTSIDDDATPKVQLITPSEKQGHTIERHHRQHSARRHEHPTDLEDRQKEQGLTQREVAELVGVSIEAYKGWEGGRHHPRSENVAPLAQALGISTDELMMEAQRRSISEDLRALFNAADKLPDDKKRQLRTAIKGCCWPSAKSS